MFKKVKQERYKRRPIFETQKLKDFFEKKRLLCDKCGLCRLSVEEIEKNYKEILERITFETAEAEKYKTARKDGKGENL